MYVVTCKLCTMQFMSGSASRAIDRLSEHITRDHGEVAIMGREARAHRTVKEMFDRELDARNVGWFTRWCVHHPRTTRAAMLLLAPIYFVGGQGEQWTHHRSLLKLLANAPDAPIAETPAGRSLVKDAVTRITK